MNQSKNQHSVMRDSNTMKEGQNQQVIQGLTKKVGAKLQRNVEDEYQQQIKRISNGETTKSQENRAVVRNNNYQNEDVDTSLPLPINKTPNSFMPAIIEPEDHNFSYSSSPFKKRIQIQSKQAQQRTSKVASKKTKPNVICFALFLCTNLSKVADQIIFHHHLYRRSMD